MTALILIVLPVFAAFTSIHHKQHEEHRNSADYSIAPFIRMPRITTERGMGYTYYGYLPYWIDSTYYDNFRYELLTDIAYFSIDLTTAGNLGSMPNAARYNKIYSNCRQYGVDIHMTITLFGSTSVSTFLNNAAARANAVSNIAGLINTYDLDGINIDFEFVTSSVRDSFTDFIYDLSDALHNHASGRKELSIAMPAVPPWYPGYDYYYLGQYTDGLFIMAYDYHYSGSSNAGPVAPTYNSAFWGYYAVNTTVDDYIDEGVERDKIILGMPYYGIDWPTVDDTRNSATTGSGSAVIYRYAKANALTYNREWDSDSYNPFYDYYSTQWHQCWYDDSLSINYKLSIARDSMIQGAGCWALGYDEGEDDIWNEIENALWWETPDSHFVLSINTPGLNARKGPGSGYDVLSVIHEGEKYIAFDAIGNWYKIYYPSASGPYYAWIYGGNGYSSQYVEGMTGDSMIRITASLLNIRSGPTTDSTVITQTSRGQCFVMDSTAGDWGRLYLADDNISGWTYYTAYSRTVKCPEDSNALTLNVDSLNYPDTVYTSSGTFNVNIYVTNNSSSVPDSQTMITGVNASPFHSTSSWTDNANVNSGGFGGVKNQHFIRTGVMGIPAVADTEMVIDTFTLTKNSSDVSNAFIVSVIVINDNLMIEEDNYYADDNETGIFDARIYDVSGRLIAKKPMNRPYLDNVTVKPGLYFIFFNGKYYKQVKYPTIVQ